MRKFAFIPVWLLTLAMKPMLPDAARDAPVEASENDAAIVV